MGRRCRSRSATSRSREALVHPPTREKDDGRGRGPSRDASPKDARRGERASLRRTAAAKSRDRRGVGRPSRLGDEARRASAPDHRTREGTLDRGSRRFSRSGGGAGLGGSRRGVLAKSGAARIEDRDRGARGSDVERCDFRYRIKGKKTPLAPPPPRRSEPDAVKRRDLRAGHDPRGNERDASARRRRVGKQTSVGRIETAPDVRKHGRTA